MTHSGFNTSTNLGMAQQVESADAENAASENPSKSIGADFTGKWQLVSNHNLDAFLTSQGLGWAKRKLAAMAWITIELKHEGDTLHINTKTPIKNIEQILTINGTDIEMEHPLSGAKVRFNLKWKDDAKMVLVIKSHDLDTNRKVTAERFMPNVNEMIDKMVNDKGATMSRKFKRVQ